MTPVPFNEAARLVALKEYGALDTDAERNFDLLTSLASSYFHAPIALVTLVDEKRQWFKSAHGIDTAETPREIAFCAHAIMSNVPLIILDAAQDPRFQDNPLVTGRPGIRFYAGAPLRTAAGFMLGTFCVIDLEPRAIFSPAKIDVLKQFSRLAVELLELRRSARSDHPGKKTGRNSLNPEIDLFSVVAHEIRSPIASIVGLTRVIQAEDLGPLGNDTYRECLKMLSETAEHAMQVTDRMLDFSRLSSGNVELREEPLCIGELLVFAIELTRSLQLERSVDVKLPSEIIEFRMKGDRAYLLQMLTNLISNAIKYGPDGSLVTLGQRKRACGELEISVTDLGCGMTAKEITMALTPFVRISDHDDDASQGVGIGLPIVKRLIEMHGGRIEIESEKSVGTTVSLIFPAYRNCDSLTYATRPGGAPFGMTTATG